MTNCPDSHGLKTRSHITIQATLVVERRYRVSRKLSECARVLASPSEWLMIRKAMREMHRAPRDLGSACRSEKPPNQTGIVWIHPCRTQKFCPGVLYHELTASHHLFPVEPDIEIAADAID